MSNSKVIVEKHEGVTRVTIYEEGEWSLLMNDIDGACIHVRCFGSVSYCVYEDDDGFTYSIPTGSSSVVSKSENRCWLRLGKTINIMYKFGQIEIESKKFNSEYQIQKDVDLEKIRVSEGVVANRCDTRFIIGYEVEPGLIVPLHIKTPKDCFSSGVTRYNESSPWKLGFNVGEDEAWVEQYEAIWWRVCEILHAPGCGFEIGGSLTGEPLSNEKYINPKLIFWNGENRTRFREGKYTRYIEEIPACHATGVLKIGSVYRQGSNYHLQVFLKECKYKKRDTNFESLLSDDEDEGYDTVH